MRLATTGTPIENRLSELWSLFAFLNPGLFGNAGRFPPPLRGAGPLEKDGLARSGNSRSWNTSLETLSNLECFVRSAEGGSFSEAARRLGLTPAAVSRNVATLERNLGVRLFQRSTRRLTLTEAGESFLLAVAGHLGALQGAIDQLSDQRKEPAGVLKVSVSLAFGVRWVLPILPKLLARYPQIRPEWHFENRVVDLIAEGYDAAIGGGFELSEGMVARQLGPAHLVAVASPSYLNSQGAPTHPTELATHKGIVLRSHNTGRRRRWSLVTAQGEQSEGGPLETLVLDDPLAAREAARVGVGIALLASCDVLSELKEGALVRVLPEWYLDAGMISLYYGTRRLVPAKVRVFVDALLEVCQKDGWAQQFDASCGH